MTTFRLPQRTDSHTLHRYFWPDYPPSYADDLVAQTIKLSQQKRGGGYVGVRDDTLCAFGMLTVWPHIGEISNLIVRANMRGQGIGTRLIHQLMQLAHALHIKDVEIGVVASNTKARALYQRLGFVTYRTVRARIRGQWQNIIYLHQSIQDGSNHIK